MGSGVGGGGLCPFSYRGQNFTIGKPSVGFRDTFSDCSPRKRLFIRSRCQNRNGVPRECMTNEEPHIHQRPLGRGLWCVIRLG